MIDAQDYHMGVACQGIRHDGLGLEPCHELHVALICDSGVDNLA